MSTLARRFVRIGWMLLAASLAFRAHVWGATPETVTLSPTNIEASWNTPTLVGTAAEDRRNCIEDVTCDTLVLVLQPGDYTGLRLRFAIDWTVAANDIDIYVFEDRMGGEQVGISNGGVPGTTESGFIALNRILTAPRRYVVQVTGNECPVPQSVHGVLRLVPEANARTAHFVLDPALRFSPNVTVAAPYAARVCEPSLRVDTRGNCYVGGIRGVPAGVDLWRFDLDPSSSAYDPQLRNPIYLGQPDAFAPNDTTGGRDGGGDIDIATSFPSDALATPIVTVVSLAAANISSAVSTDRGENFALSPAVAAAPADDRQWIEAAGSDTIYCFYRAPIPATGLFVQRSVDHGVTYPVVSLVSASGTTPGYIDVDHNSGAVYVSHMSVSAVFVSRSLDGGVTWQTFTANNSTGHRHLFDPVKVGDDGTVYVAWSDNSVIWLAHSTDRAETWSAPVKVSSGETKFALFPWLETGSDGRVAVVWYGSTSASNTNASDWHCWLALVTNAKGTTPTVRVAEVSDHVIHASNLSQGGLVLPPAPVGIEPNRNLCDYFQVAVDPLGACVVAFTDDHDDYDGQTFVARQISGPSLYASANGGTGVLDPAEPLPFPAPDPSLPEVSDFLHDATANNLEPINGDSPYDILSIDYDCEPAGAAALLVARMKVSGLTPVPANSFWRVNFAANAPGPVADRGDQFYLRADTGSDPLAPIFTFGTVVRDTAGDLVYTERGAATAGAMDQANSEVVVKIGLGSLNPYVTHGGPVRPGSALVGLRGQTGTLEAGTARDLTRGQGSYVMCADLLDAPQHAARPVFALGAPRPNPSRGGASFDLSLSTSAWTDLAVFDAAGRRVRTIFAGTLPAGQAAMRWDGRTDGGRPAPSGVYHLRMSAAGHLQGQRLVLVK